MEELKKYFDEIQKKIKEMESRHETDIDSFYNLDEGAWEELRGDWTKREIENYRYLLNRSTILYKAIKIVEEERLAERISSR